MDEPIARLLAQLSPEQLAELFTQARQRAASTSSTQTGTRLRVRITEGFSLRPSRQADALPRPEDEPTRRALDRISPALRAAFVKAEGQVLTWLRSSHEHRTRFLLDPVAALKEAVPDFDEHLIREITTLRDASSKSMPDVPGYKLDSLELEVAGQDQKEKK